MIKILKLSIFMMVVLSLGQCKTKEITVTQTKYDTINTHTIERIEVPINHTITIDNPCDSTGILKNFKQTLKTKNTTVVLSGNNGAIVATVNIDSIKQVWKSQYVGKTEVIVKEVPVDKPVPFIPKVFWISSIILVVYIVYRVLRIYVPFLKILPY